MLLSISTELLGYKFGQLLWCLLSANECLYKRLAYYCLTIYSVVLRSRTLLGKFSALFYFLYLHPPGFLPLRGFKEMLLESVLWFFSDVMSFESLSMLLYNIFVCGIVGSSINLKRKFWSVVWQRDVILLILARSQFPNRLDLTRQSGRLCPNEIVQKAVKTKQKLFVDSLSPTKPKHESLCIQCLLHLPVDPMSM